MENHPSSGEPRQRPSLSFLERNVFLLAGLVVISALAALLAYGWMSFLRPSTEAETLAAAEPGSSAARPAPGSEDLLQVPPPSSPGGHVQSANLQTISQGNHLAVETLPPAVREEEIAKGDAIIKQFIEAPSWQEKVPFVYEGERVGKAMQQFYDTPGKSETKLGAMETVGIYRLGSNTVQLRVYRGATANGNHELVLRRQANGSYLLDWEAYVGAGGMNWDDFVREKPTQPVLFRMYASTGDRYTQEFEDAQRFLCVRLVSTDRSRSVFAYCERRSSAARSLSEVLTDNTLTPVTLRISFPSGVSSIDSLKVDEFIAPHWLVP